jgi:hypothetical protein
VVAIARLASHYLLAAGEWHRPGSLRMRAVRISPDSEEPASTPRRVRKRV